MNKDSTVREAERRRSFPSLIVQIFLEVISCDNAVENRPPNITIVALPPKFPELNPVENVWQYMCDNWLSNRIFKSYDDLVDHCCEAWNKLVERIMSIRLRQWAHGF